MAGNTISNTFTVPDAVGVREDLGNIIFNVSPNATPFVSNIGKAACSNVFFEWQTDSLGAPDTANAQVEGDDIVAFSAITPTVRLGNRTQISRKEIIISKTEQKVNKAGRSNEKAYQTVMMGKRLRNDIEAICLSNQAAVPASAGTAGTTASVLSWINTNTNFDGGGGSDPTGDGSDTRTDGTPRTLDESMLKDVLGQIFTNSTEDPDFILAPPLLKQAISAFTGPGTRFENTDNKKLVTAVDIYVSDFYSTRIVPSRFSRSTDVLIINESFWKMRWLRPISLVDLATTGDADKAMLVAEWGLEASNEAASGGIFDVQP